MRFGEVGGVALLSALVAVGILLTDRLAPDQVAAPGTVMSKAISNAERQARAARRPDAAGAPSTGTPPAGTPAPSGMIGATMMATGHPCPFVRRVMPLQPGNGIYRVICADMRSGGVERAFRMDTRAGTVTPDTPEP